MVDLTVAIEEHKIMPVFSFPHMQYQAIRPQKLCKSFTIKTCTYRQVVCCFKISRRCTLYIDWIPICWIAQSITPNICYVPLMAKWNHCATFNTKPCAHQGRCLIYGINSVYLFTVVRARVIFEVAWGKRGLQWMTFRFLTKLTLGVMKMFPVRIEVVTQRLSTTECIIRSVTALILYWCLY